MIEIKKKTSGDVYQRATDVEIVNVRSYLQETKTQESCLRTDGIAWRDILLFPNPYLTLPSLLTWHILIRVQTYKTNNRSK